MHDPVRTVHRQVWRAIGVSEGERTIAEETAVALTYDGGSYAVMMATPSDLRDFAIGFSLSEGIVESAADIASLEEVASPSGIELRMWLQKADAERLARRRRNIAGPTGCGLCGIDSLEQAMRPPTRVSVGARFSPQDIMRAMAALPALQKLNIETRAVHAAAFWHPSQGIVAVREDVGRHNALDKLIGALSQQRFDVAAGLLLMTSRVSVELVQKAATIGVSTLVSVSAPTALAVRMAEQAGMTLVAIARADGFEVFTHADRIATGASAHVA